MIGRGAAPISRIISVPTPCENYASARLGVWANIGQVGVSGPVMAGEDIQLYKEATLLLAVKMVRFGSIVCACECVCMVRVCVCRGDATIYSFDPLTPAASIDPLCKPIIAEWLYIGQTHNPDLSH